MLVLDNLQSAANDTAVLDLTADPPGWAKYSVPPGSITNVQMNAAGMATSTNLFPLIGSYPWTITCNTTSGPPNYNSTNIPSTAVLRQKQFTMVVPPIDKTQGTLFQVPIGTLATSSTYLLFGSAGGGTVLTQITVGTSSPVTIPVPSNGAKYVITQPNVKVAILGQSFITVQLVNNWGNQKFSMDFVLPE